MVENEILGMAGTLSKGIIAQFPGQFDSRAAGRRRATPPATGLLFRCTAWPTGSTPATRAACVEATENVHILRECWLRPGQGRTSARPCSDAVDTALLHAVGNDPTRSQSSTPATEKRSAWG